jgi:drug/metabolite transporter (DMT)-like permease
VVDLARGAERAPGAKADGTTGRPSLPAGTAPGGPATLLDVSAIIGGLGAAMLWAAATLCSSRSSRMLGSRVVLGWIMVVGVVVGLPIAVVSPGPATVEPSTFGLLGLAGICYVVGLQLTYAALRIGKVSIVAPIVATEGAVAALISIARGDAVGFVAGISLAVIVGGVVLSSLEPGRADVLAGDFDVVADAIDEPPSVPPPTDAVQPPNDARRATLLAIGAALIFGVGLVAAGTAASLVPVAWVAVVVPLVLARRLRVTRVALPLVLIAGVAEVLGSMLSAWGSRESIAITAVMGSQFAAFAAVAAFILFGERLGRLQVAGVVLIGVGVTVLAATTA